MKYVCPVCKNSEHADNAKFCMICGAKISEATKKSPRYRMEFILELDVADKALKDMLRQMRMPYPILQRAFKITETVEAPEVFSKAEKEALAKAFIDELKGKEFGSYIIENVHFAGLRNVERIEEDADG